MTNTRPVYNTQAAIAASADGKIKVYLISPWVSFFQQFVQKVAAAVPVVLDGSPFLYTPNQNGNIHIIGGTVSNVSIIRGADTLDVTGQKLIPIGIGDSLQVTYTVAPTIKFLGT